jgi:hypothetical protein
MTTSLIIVLALVAQCPTGRCSAPAAPAGVVAHPTAAAPVIYRYPTAYPAPVYYQPVPVYRYDYYSVPTVRGRACAGGRCR